ncbi:unnamed protein product [Calicophoron daubneyi]|uniref:BZIP domain-containing protein n=1 Tax=Calicophoron daubneyi TaxID=300641 RepID=A0AAV2TWE5_CALDB
MTVAGADRILFDPVQIGHQSTTNLTPRTLSTMSLPAIGPMPNPLLSMSTPQFVPMPALLDPSYPSDLLKIAFNVALRPQFSQTSRIRAESCQPFGRKLHDVCGSVSSLEASRSDEQPLDLTTNPKNNSSASPEIENVHSIRSLPNPDQPGEKNSQLNHCPGGVLSKNGFKAREESFRPVHPANLIVKTTRSNSVTFPLKVDEIPINPPPLTSLLPGTDQPTVTASSDFQVSAKNDSNVNGRRRKTLTVRRPFKRTDRSEPKVGGEFCENLRALNTDLPAHDDFRPNAASALSDTEGYRTQDARTETTNPRTANNPRTRRSQSAFDNRSPTQTTNSPPSKKNVLETSPDSDTRGARTKTNQFGSFSADHTLCNPRMRRYPEMTPNEIKDQAYWEKRVKNNEAARRSRRARKSKEASLRDYASQLENSNAKLMEEIEQLKQEVNRLKSEKRKSPDS